MRKLTLTVPESFRPWLTRPVGILGGGVSGVGVTALLATIGAESVIYDAKGTPFSAKAAKAHGLVVFSPGFAPEHEWLALARAAGCECLNELDFASAFWRGAIIAVTGTNGKTTLTEFLTHALRATSHEAHATGNIGHSFAQLVAASDGGTTETIAVCEVSSFQAETLKRFRADATLWTNFAEDHLERHPGLESYFGAKWNLVARTKPGAVFAGSSVQRFAEKFNRPLPASAAIQTEGVAADARLHGTVFAEYPQRENFVLAAAWWRVAGLPEEALITAAQNFQLGRHRLARIGEHEGVTFWNDSKATNFHAVEAALARFEKPVVLIAGGKAKGGDLA
ncbi:MAG TPA: UDP-N-acetylmuramoyl-L-alanine--D-glutamate ligase, partial [Opitutus sp.]|nr:UDP-N-acetylmuramoyl-L-alanine--D-glutamate ligase [Opitutus sp.]